MRKKSREQYLRENDLIYGPYKTEKNTDIVSNFNAYCPNIKGRKIFGFYNNEKANNKNSIHNLSNNFIFGSGSYIYC